MGSYRGMFFRHSTKQIAETSELVGFVKNLPDDSVEIIAEGQKEKLEELARWAIRGPEGAHVTRCETERQKATGKFQTFSIK